MVKENANVADGSNEDLSEEIARTVEKRASDQVTCRRITRNHYRCNWWSLESTKGYDNPGMAGMLVTTSRIRQSHFLEARRTPEGLQIDVISTPGTRAVGSRLVR
jgi:hypothetical protein